MGRAGTGVVVVGLVLGVPCAVHGQLVAGGGFADGIMSGCETDVRRLNQVSGWQVRWPGQLESAGVATAAEREATLALWEGVPAALEADVAALRGGIERGTTAPRPVVDRVLAQVDGLLETPRGESPLWSPGRRSSDRAFTAAWEGLVARRLLPALRAYRDFLAGEYRAGARGSMGLGATPDGASCFTRLIEAWTSLPRTPGEVEAVGRRELSRLQGELMRLAAPRYGTTLAEVLDRLRGGELPDAFRSREDVVRHAEAAIARAEAAVGEWIGTPGHVPIRVEAMPAFMEGSFPAGFYRAPGADGVAAYVVNTSRPAERRLLSEAIAFHEAIPGHHTHASARAAGAAAGTVGAGSGAFVSGLAEGWAIYAEGLADEMGLYSSELDRIGRIAKHLWATSRLVVEPGLHVHGWSRDRAIAFMLENTALTRDEIALEVDRYPALPGQSLGYMLGNLHLRALRDTAEARLGSAFDIRRFHDVVLTRGMRPLPEVSEDVKRWIGDVESAGTTVPEIRAVSDTTQSYALYLPPGHDTGRQWPAILLMDPRGRAMLPLELFREAAGRHGFVLISSYDTSSDQPTSGVDTRRAVEVLLNESVERLALDLHRVYLAGFSGTARLGWSIAVQNPEIVAGVASFGGGIPRVTTLLERMNGEDPHVGAYFGGAGRTDFNYQEVRETQALLADRGGFNRIRYYDGPHAWPPAEVAAEAVEWLALYGRRTGRAPVDSARSAAELAGHTARAEALERAGRPYEAWTVYDGAVTGFEGLADVSIARSRLERLGRDRTVRRTLRDLDRWAEWEEVGRDRLMHGLAGLDESPLPTVDALSERTGLPELLRQAASSDTLAAQAAERLRSLLVTMAAFYRFRALVEAGQPERAVRSLELARRAAPDSPAVCYRFRQVPESDRPAGSPLNEACREADEPPG